MTVMGYAPQETFYATRDGVDYYIGENGLVYPKPTVNNIPYTPAPLPGPAQTAPPPVLLNSQTPAEVAQAAVATQSCPTWADLQIGCYNNLPDTSGTRQFVFSDSPRLGKYWVIPYIDAICTDASIAQQLAFFLLPPASGITKATVLDTTTFWQVPGMEGAMVLIQPGMSQGASSNAMVSQRACLSPLGFQKIILPTGWQVMCVEASNGIGASPHHLRLRMAYLELNVNQEIPNGL